MRCRRCTSSVGGDSTAVPRCHGRGKRAAFALFYGPLHLCSCVGLCGPPGRPARIADRGFGVWDGRGWRGMGGACVRSPAVLGVDCHPWTLSEARRFTRSSDWPREFVTSIRVNALPRQPLAVVAAFTLNELPESARDALLTQALIAVVMTVIAVIGRANRIRCSSSNRSRDSCAVGGRWKDASRPQVDGRTSGGSASICRLWSRSSIGPRSQSSSIDRPVALALVTTETMRARGHGKPRASFGIGSRSGWDPSAVRDDDVR